MVMMQSLRQSFEVQPKRVIARDDITATGAKRFETRLSRSVAQLRHATYINKRP